MRYVALASSLLALCLATPVAEALTEPNGKQIPIDSANGEEQLYSLFQMRGDPVDWQADAGIQPSTFSPLCDFSATFVLNQAGEHLGLAWYNATGSAPPASDLHIIFPAGTAVGTVVASNVIKGDPAYQGGLVGFALVGAQTHYSERKWDPVCSGCNPPAPWIGAIIYASKNTPNAFYIAFEDGTMGAGPNNFANDGDFNDDVFFLTGLTCAGGGQPCNTGMPGACAEGVTECTPTGTTCKQITQPSKETCNGIDDDCNGMVDDGNNLCPTNYVCDKGMCVMACGSGEFTCAGNQTCVSGYCIDNDCASVMCDAGKVCVGGTCKAPCDGVSCPYPELCVASGTCVDLCAGVMCDSSQVCDLGVCVPSCSCAPCSMGLACDSGSGQCVDPSCVGKTCGAGTHCESGACVDNCKGAQCPSGQTCQSGQCVKSQGSGGGSGSSNGGGLQSTGPFGSGQGGGSSGTESGSGTKSGSTGSNGFGGGSSSGSGESGGCGCRVAGDDRPATGLGLAGLLALASLSLRRRRKLRP